MDDSLNILLAFIIGVLTVFITVPYPLKEAIRKDVNRCIETVGDEMDWNRTSVVHYKEHISKIRQRWNENKKIENFRTWYFSLTVGNNGPIYTTLKFDAFNYYKNTETPSVVGIAFDYMLTEFYSECKRFCYNLDLIQNNIMKYNSEEKYCLVEEEWKKIDNEFYNFNSAFRKYTSVFSEDLKDVKYYGIKKISWFDWHVSKICEIRIIFKDDIKLWKESKYDT